MAHFHKPYRDINGSPFHTETPETSPLCAIRLLSKSGGSWGYSKAILTWGKEKKHADTHKHSSTNMDLFKTNVVTRCHWTLFWSVSNRKQEVDSAVCVLLDEGYQCPSSCCGVSMSGLRHGIRVEGYATLLNSVEQQLPVACSHRALLLQFLSSPRWPPGQCWLITFPSRPFHSLSKNLLVLLDGT